jgi:hypothetical protein
MDDLFPLYLKAAFLVAFALALTVAVTALAWRSNLYFLRRAVAWCRGLPERRRAARDPAFRAARERAVCDAEILDQYEVMTGMLILARTRRRHSERILEEHGGAEAPQTALVAERHEADLEAHVGQRTVIGAYFARLTDDDIAAIARGVNAKAYGGRIPQAELEAFFREERERIAENEYLADTHFVRLVGRFAAYAQPPA